MAKGSLPCMDPDNTRPNLPFVVYPEENDKTRALIPGKTEPGFRFHIRLYSPDRHTTHHPDRDEYPEP
jgi:hypothetical protein